MHQRSKTRLEKNWGFAKAQGEMFGPAKAFTKKYLKTMDLKRRSWQICGAIVAVGILVFVFSVSPKHLDIRLPSNEDLLETPMLRGQELDFDYQENHYLKRRIVDFLLESCAQLKTYDMLFCQNILVNGQALQEPCFAVCEEQIFYANLKVSRTDEEGSVLCTETYADITEQKRRPQGIVLSGERFHGGAEAAEMLEFTRVPKSAIEVCRFQHALDIVTGQWIASL